jgi:hypothetical protein
LKLAPVPTTTIARSDTIDKPNRAPRHKNKNKKITAEAIQSNTGETANRTPDLFYAKEALYH